MALNSQNVLFLSKIKTWLKSIELFGLVWDSNPRTPAFQTLAPGHEMRVNQEVKQ